MRESEGFIYIYTERGVLKTEAEIGERGSVGEALKDAIEVARVAEVFEP